MILAWKEGSTDKHLECVLRLSSPTIANALRRSMLLYVPSLAFQYVEFLINTTTFPDAFLAHRFAMVPVQQNQEQKDLLTYAKNCPCDGVKCSQCSIFCTLDVTNKQEMGSIPVKWGDIQIPDSCKQIVSILNPEEIICMLGAGKSLKCKLWIMKSTHCQHSKAAVASTIGLFPVSEDGAYCLRIESIGTRPTKYVLLEACQALIARLQELRNI